MDAKQAKILEDELKGVSPFILNETLNYLRYLKGTKQNQVIGYSSDKALTLENYKQHIDSSRLEYDNGNFTSVEDLENQ